MSRYDEAGMEINGIKRLPGNSDDWETLGKEVSDRRKKEDTILYKATRKFKWLRKS